MKILFATDAAYTSSGGLQVTVRRLARRLSQDGDEILIVAPSDNYHNSLSIDGEIKIFGIKSVYSPIYKNSRFTLPITSRNAIKKIIRNEMPDVIHVHTPGSIGMAATNTAKKLGIPVLATSHSTIENLLLLVPRQPGMVLKIVRGQLIKIIRNFLVKADVVTSPSVFAQRYTNEKFGITKENIVLSNGIDLHKFNLKKHTAKTPVILSVGRLDKDKRMEVIISALPRILKHLRVKLVLVGQGSQLENLKALATKLNVERSVKFLGQISENKLPAVYSQANVYVNATVSEVLGLSVLEAMASGLPVLATNSGALPELVVNGSNGFLFNEGSYSQLADKIITILSDKKLAESMGNQSLKLVQKHDIENVIVDLKSIYQKTIYTSILNKNLAALAPSRSYRPALVKITLSIFLFLGIFRYAVSPASAAHVKLLALGNKIKNSPTAKVIKNAGSSIQQKIIHYKYKNKKWSGTPTINDLPFA